MLSRQGKFLTVAAAFLAAASFVTAYSMLRASAWTVDIGTTVFIAWAISPYLCFFAASRLLVKLSPRSSIGLPAAVIAALMFAFTTYAYIGTMGDASSTYALIFVFVPLYLYIGSFFILSLVILVSRLLNARA